MERFNYNALVCRLFALSGRHHASVWLHSITCHSVVQSACLPHVSGAGRCSRRTAPLAPWRAGRRAREMAAPGRSLATPTAATRVPQGLPRQDAQGGHSSVLDLLNVQSNANTSFLCAGPLPLLYSNWREPMSIDFLGVVHLPFELNPGTKPKDRL